MHLVDVSQHPIERFTARGLVTGGKEYTFDDVVFATGFDAMTGSLLRMDIRGKGGVSLNEKWAAGPLTYLGLMVAGFPNLFTMTGPGSPSVLANMVTGVEQHAEYIRDVIAWLRKRERGRGRSAHRRGARLGADGERPLAAHALSALQFLVSRRQRAR